MYKWIFVSCVITFYGSTLPELFIITVVVFDVVVVRKRPL